MMTVILSARDAARDLIYRYVERGDSLEYLRRSHMGYAGARYWAEIAGCMDISGGRKCFGPDWIIVTKVAGQSCNERINLPRLYAEIQHELAGGEVQTVLL